MKRILEKFWQALSPEGITCIVCGAELNHDSRYSMCDSCLKKMPLIKKSCEKCGREIYDDSKLCFDCAGSGAKYDKVYSVLNYEGVVAGLIYRLKYGGEKYLAKYLARFMVDRLKEANVKFDIIVPVPLNKNRFKKRGFNQAELLADEIASELNTQAVSCMDRVVDTPFQARLTREERLTNLKDAFVIGDKSLVKGKTVLIIDDIFTTGSTINECATVLFKAKAKSVIAITLSHAKKKFV